MYVLCILYVSLVISICLKSPGFLHALHHMTATILTKGKDSWTDDLSTIFAMGDHISATILTNGRSDDLTAILAMGYCHHCLPALLA